MLGDRSCTAITVPNGRSIKEYHWILCPVLVFFGKVPVVHMAGNRGHFKVGSVSLEMPFERVDRDSFGRTCFLFKVLTAQSFCD
jgi:hypothetical protein